MRGIDWPDIIASMIIAGITAGVVGLSGAPLWAVVGFACVTYTTAKGLSS